MRLSGVMLSIGKLSAGQEGYYLAGVAHGVEDYYIEAGEVPGRWLGRGAETLGLAGDVGDGEFRAVLSGVDPSTGIRLRRSNARLCAFDLTLSAPKSVSLLWALGDPDTTNAIIAAHEHAVDQTMGYLEREAVQSRRGHDGKETVEGGGVIGAAFRHRTSRAGDPQLHTHVLVANTTLCEDGVWRALDGRLLYAQARTAGFLYQAELRHAPTRSLGVAWEYPMSGQAEIAGFGREVLREFSTRRIEIEEAAAEVGNDSVRSRRRLALETRTAKDYNVDPEQLRTNWRERADLHGLSRGRVEELSRPQHASEQPSVRRPALTALESDDTLLASIMNTDDSTFDRRAVLRLVANHCQPGATIEQGFTDSVRCLRRARRAIAHENGQDALVGRYAERRQRSWDWAVRWAREHPKLSRLTACFTAILTAGWIVLLIASAAASRWGEALYWIAASVVGLWATWSWIRINRGEGRTTRWRG
jgi:conjugative relaxase-like TrwC/TraI family protein